MWMIDSKDRVADASICPNAANEWMAEAEDPKISHWKELGPDPIHLRRISRKVATGFMPLINDKPELKIRVDMERVELNKVNKQFSGRALYWIILHELRRSLNSKGLSNLKDLQNVTCRGPTVYHLRMYQTHWDRCIMNFCQPT